MTFREMLKKEYPEKVDNCYTGGCYSCPYDYGYEGHDDGLCLGSGDDDEEMCRECWDREIPTLEKKKTSTVRLPDTVTVKIGPEDSATEQHDPVNHPSHYTSGSIEVIDCIESIIAPISDPVQAFLVGQVVKYVARYTMKNGEEDLRKANWYLNRLIERVNSTGRMENH